MRARGIALRKRACIGGGSLPSFLDWHSIEHGDVFFYARARNERSVSCFAGGLLSYVGLCPVRAAVHGIKNQAKMLKQKNALRCLT